MTIDTRLPVVRGTGGAPAYSDAVRRKIIASLKLGTTRSAAFRAAGIAETTFYRWLEEDSGFRESVEQAEGHAERAYTLDLRRQAAQGATAAVQFWLERRRPAEWRRRDELIVRNPTIEDNLDEQDEATLRELLAHIRRSRLSGARNEDPASARSEGGAE